MPPFETHELILGGLFNTETGEKLADITELTTLDLIYEEIPESFRLPPAQSCTFTVTGKIFPHCTNRRRRTLIRELLGIDYLAMKFPKKKKRRAKRLKRRMKNEQNSQI